jgi:hypothetical protein
LAKVAEVDWKPGLARLDASSVNRLGHLQIVVLALGRSGKAIAIPVNFAAQPSEPVFGEAVTNIAMFLKLATENRTAVSAMFSRLATHSDGGLAFSPRGRPACE